MAGKMKHLELLPELVRLRNMGKSLNQIHDITGLATETVRLMLHRTGNWEPLASGHRKPVDYSHIGSLWWAEFRGFFYGEGCVYFRDMKTRTSFKNPTSRRKLSPTLTIALRRDDSSVLEEIHHTLGGLFHLKPAHGKTNEAAAWSMNGWSPVYNVLLYLLDGLLPSKKGKELTLVKEACELRFTFSYDLSDDERSRLYEYHTRLRELKLLRS